MISIKTKLLFLFAIFLISCQTQIKYRTVPLTTPPQKYYISDYKTKKELYFEYQHALMTIKEWQLWYNLNARTNYYNYNDITNINELNIDLDTIITNDYLTNIIK
ncbi:hypothetical protein [Brachyspira sp.]|uniref:hypothetical protein n=1 Tax=Brachyspira sp. TaxID=1977261 RepID=UPI003D7CFBC9